MYNIFNFITKIIYLNLLFITTELPFLIVVWVVGIAKILHYPFFVLLGFVCLPPALIALTKIIYEWVKNDKLVSAKRFYKFYIHSFSKDNFVIYLILLIPIGLYLNEFIVKNIPIFSFLVPLYYLLTILSYLMLPFAIVEVTFFNLSFFNRLKNILIETIVHPGIIAMNMIYGVFILLIVSEFPASILLWSVSLYVYLFVMFFGENLEKRIEVAHKISDQSNVSI